MERKYEFIILILYSALIFSLSSIQGSEIPSQISPYSLFFHFFLYLFYGGIVFLFFIDWKKSIAFGIIYAMSDELHQYFVPGRSCDPVDFLVDSIGIIIAVLILVKWKSLSTFLS